MKCRLIYGFGFSLASFTSLSMLAAEKENHSTGEESSMGAGQVPAQRSYLYALQPEGKTLPTGLLRVRLPYASSTAKEGFDKDGNRVDNGFRLKATGGAIVLEYGLNDRISIQFLTKYIQSMNISMNSAAFKTSRAYNETTSSLYSKSFGEGISNQADAYTKIASGIAAKLAANGACGADALTSASCLAKINDSNFPAPVTLDGSSLNLPGLTIEKDQDIKTVLSIYTKGLDQKISEGVLEGAKSLERDGAIGISDTEIGALYEVVNTAPLFFSVGGGLRLPTGKCQNLGTHEIETGGCVTDLGLRINLDYLPFDSFMLSWQNQSEKMLMKGKIERDNTTQDIAWNGVRQVGFIYLKPSLSSLNSRLNVLAPKVGLTYKLNSAKELDDVEEARERGYQSLASLGLDLTRYQLPIQMDLEYTKPIKGENQIFAPTTTTLTLKLFAKL